MFAPSRGVSLWYFMIMMDVLFTHLGGTMSPANIVLNMNQLFWSTKHDPNVGTVQLIGCDGVWFVLACLSIHLSRMIVPRVAFEPQQRSSEVSSSHQTTLCIVNHRGTVCHARDLWPTLISQRKQTTEATTSSRLRMQCKSPNNLLFPSLPEKAHTGHIKMH